VRKTWKERVLPHQSITWIRPTFEKGKKREKRKKRGREKREGRDGPAAVSPGLRLLLLREEKGVRGKGGESRRPGMAADMFVYLQKKKKKRGKEGRTAGRGALATGFFASANGRFLISSWKKKEEEDEEKKNTTAALDL